MVTRWLTRVAVASAVVGAVTIVGVSVASADPPGNNGTVKINSQDVDSSDDISNNPHVPCDFQVEFFGFDKDQTATITFTIHPPSGDGDVLLSETKTVSDDGAGGGLNDVDEVFKYSGTTFGLNRFTAQPQQGYHVKLTVESAGLPGGKKHKVFWLKCAPASPSPSPSAVRSPSQSPAASQPPSSTHPASTSPAAGGLPVTGSALGGLITTGLALIGSGLALLFVRRRRTAREGTAES